MYSSQKTISNNAHESNIPGFINDNCNNLPQITATTAIQAENPSNINCNDPSCSICFSGINNNNNIFSTQTSIFPDHNNNQPSVPNNTTNNNAIISPGHNYQQPI